MNDPRLKPLSLSTRVVLVLSKPIGHLMRFFGYQPFAERCSWCRKDLPAGSAFYIDGRRICEQCAERGRRRMLRAAWAYIVLTVILIIASGLGVMMSFRRGDPDAWLLVPIMAVISLFPLGLLWFVLRTMRAANRRVDEHEQAVVMFNELRALIERSRADEKS